MIDPKSQKELADAWETFEQVRRDYHAGQREGRERMESAFGDYQKVKARVEAHE
jgi:cell fate (sporulation/competence/biofilm development) regulator YlbF (YheA/YmcA/DUF963 family)